MDGDSNLEATLHMNPLSLSVREQHCYRAEKMLMRQFMVMRQCYQVPIYITVKDVKRWLLNGRNFLHEFKRTARVTEARTLHMAELAWISERRLCHNKMEQELREELEKEKRLSLQFRMKVTLEGFEMLLSITRPKLEQNVQVFLRVLSTKLLVSFTESSTCKRSKLALFTKLWRTTVALSSDVVETALAFLLDKPFQGQGSGAITDSLWSRAEAAAAQIGSLLADAVATCFSLVASGKERLLSICTSRAQDMVQSIYERLIERSKSFHLLDFDESFICARKAAVFAVQDMDDKSAEECGGSREDL